MKHRAHHTSYRNNSGFKNTVSTVVAVPITYDEQKKIYKFKEKKLVPELIQDTDTSSKQLRNTCDNLSLADQAVRPDIRFAFGRNDHRRVDTGLSRSGKRRCSSLLILCFPPF